MKPYCRVNGCENESATSGVDNLCQRHYERKFVRLLPDWDEPSYQWDGRPKFHNWEVFLKDWRENIVPALVR